MRNRSRISISATLVSALLLGLGLTTPAYAADLPCYTVVSGVLTDGSDCKGAVSIDNSVTSIGEEAFKGNSNLTSIDIASSVNSIGRAAFWGTSLTTVVIPNGVTSISAELFRTTTSLTSVTIPNSVTSIEDAAFDGTSLASITIPSSVTRIGWMAFSHNHSLTSIVIPEGVTSLGHEAFWDDSLLTSVILPDSLLSLDDGLFLNATSLSNVRFSKYLTHIGRAVFVNTALTSVTIPGTVNQIDQYAFAYMPNLKLAVIQNGVKRLLYGVFSNDPSLSNVVIPNSITSIGYAFELDGSDPDEDYGFQTIFQNSDQVKCASLPNLSGDAFLGGWGFMESFGDVTACSRKASGISISSASVATVVATAYLPATTLRFGTTVETASVTVIPISNPATVSATPFVTSDSTKIVDIQVTGSNSGSVTVCLDGTATDHIFHYVDAMWTQLPSQSFTGGQVCGVTTSFSPFVAAPVAVVSLVVSSSATDAAAKAAAEAAAAKRESEKQAARTEITTKLKSASQLTVESFAQAEIPGITSSNISLVQTEILALPEELRTDINQVIKIARKYEVIGNIGSDQIKYLAPDSFIEIGLIPTTSKNKVALVAAIKKLPATARDTYPEIKAAIEVETMKIQARKDRLAAVVARNSARSSRR